MSAAATQPLTGISRACKGTTPLELYIWEIRKVDSAGAVEGARLPESAQRQVGRLAWATHFALNNCALSRNAHVAPISIQAHMALAKRACD